MKSRARHPRRLTVYLALLFLETAVAANVVAFGVVRLFSDETVIGPAGERNLNHYLALLSAEAGTPPTAAGAQSVEAATGARVRIEDAAGTVIAGADLPSWSELESARASRRLFRERAWVRHGGRFAMTYSHGGWRYSFFAPVTRSGFPEAVPLALAAALLVVFFTAHWAARRLVRPLSGLDKAMHEFGGGNLDIRVKPSKVYEFASLTDAFHNMAKSIRGLILARDQLLGDVSHELRSPLARMKLALELMPPGSARSDVQDDIRRLESIVAQLLDGARFDQGGTALTLADADLSQVVEDSLAEGGERLGRLEFTSPKGGGPTVRVDQRWIKVVLRNLIDNALKYSTGSNATVRVTISAQGPSACVVVQDGGVGISSADLERVFDPFFRVDPARTSTPSQGDTQGPSGVGLGLHLCKKIILAHGGTIDLRSALGVGTTVTVTLPRV